MFLLQTDKVHKNIMDNRQEVAVIKKNTKQTQGTLEDPEIKLRKHSPFDNFDVKTRKRKN